MDLNDDTKWKIIKTLPAERPQNFWRSILLSITKPHVINRRLAGAELLAVFRCSATELNSDGKFMRQIAQTISNHGDDEIDSDALAKILQETGATGDGFEQDSAEVLVNVDLNKEKQILVILNKLLPKNLAAHKCTYEIAILGNYACFMSAAHN